MPDKPLSDLRRRMLADMTIRSFGDKNPARLYPSCRDPGRIPRPLA